MTGISPRLLLWRMILGVLFLLLLWRVILLGVADHFAMGLEGGDPDAADKVLTWNSGHSVALIDEAERSLTSDPARTIELAGRASIADPGNALPLTLLARAHLQVGDTELADAFAGKARELMPTRVPPLLQLAEYWSSRNQLDRTLDILSIVLTAQPELGRSLYPRLLKLVETPSLRSAFEPLTQQPPAWWDAFYTQVAQRAVELETVAVLTTMRRDSPVPLSEAERRAAVARLLRENEWPAAYLMWVNGLSQEQRKHLGSIYNGNFELEVDGQGFGWHFPQIKDITVTRQKTFGIRGEKALHLIFEGREVRFNHLFQRLFLAPGNYEFVAQARPDRLQGRGGLQWVIHCADDESAELGRSERFLGTSEWRHVKFRFSVPQEACSGQTLRLQSTGKRLFDHKLSGEVWFDQLRIRRAGDV